MASNTDSSFSSDESFESADSDQDTDYITEDEQLEDENNEGLPGNTPYDKPIVAFSDSLIEIIIQRVSFRRQK